MTDSDNHGFIIALVGEPPRPEMIARATLHQAVEQLSQDFRDCGLSGDDLDQAISESLPAYLGALIYGEGLTRH